MAVVLANSFNTFIILSLCSSVCFVYNSSMVWKKWTVSLSLLLVFFASSWAVLWPGFFRVHDLDYKRPEVMFGGFERAAHLAREGF